MKRALLMAIGILNTIVFAGASDLSTAPSQDLLKTYQQLRSLQGSRQYASVEEVVLKRDVATFTFFNGYITFAEPVAGQILAAKFEGEGAFELAPVSPVDQRQIARFAEGSKLVDTFNEAIFFFTDDTFAELEKQIRVRVGEKAGQPKFDSIQKQYAESYNDWIDNQRKGYPTMRNMAARMLADLTDNTSKGFFLADFKGDKSGNLLFHISWNRDSLLLPHTTMSDEVILLHLNPGDYYEWWSGFHLSHEYENSPYPDHRDFYVHCPEARIDLEIAGNERISGAGELDYTVLEGSLRVIPFNLSNVLRISSIEDGEGNALSFIQENRNLDNDPWVILEKPMQAGEKNKIKISYTEESTYESRIIHDRGGRQYFVASRDSWYPSFGRYDDRTHYEINVRSPKSFKLVASGLQTDSREEGDVLITSWKSEIPLGSIGFSYGDLVEASQEVSDMKFTAFAGRNPSDELLAMQTAADGVSFSSRKRGTGIMRAGMNTAGTVKDAVALSIPAFKLFEFLFGPSPFKVISVVQQPTRSAGRGWPNMIVVPYTYFLDSTVKNQLGMTKTAEQREFQRTVAVNEMAHQWMEHLVGSKTYRDQWLRDGGADFASLMYLRQFDPSELDSFMDIRRRWLLGNNALGYRPVDAGPVWMNRQLNQYKAEGNSGYVTRYKGGYILEMIRMLMQDVKMQNPDARFIAMMRDFTKTYAGQNASTQDFQRIVEKHTGRSAQWFFDQWIYGSETPTYDFSYQLSDAGDGKTEVTISLTQSDVSESFRMMLPIYAVVSGEQQYLGMIGITGTKPLNTSMQLPMRPEKVILDPNRSILAEINQ